jgi:glycoprotein endo-alpha-1,2-mannosidase
MIVFVMLMLSFLSACDDEPEPTGPVAVTKTNSMQIYMHYMPWFQSKLVSGYWGSHWKMKNKNPDVIDGNGKRQIASHYYPLIGPYDSKDPDVVEYHLLLMKYAGVDAVIIDWYGSHVVNDYKVNLTGSNAIIDKLDETGIKFAIAYEDFTAEVVAAQTTKSALQAAQADVEYLKANYFSNSQYVNIDEAPLLLTFGPRYFKTPSQWTTIFSSLDKKPKFLPLWNHTQYTGENDRGEFSWVDFNESLSDLSNFYNRLPHIEIGMGSAYPRFHDFYEEGGTGSSYGYVPYNEGQTLENTLNKAKERGAEHLQLVTWNDFGEGTVIEPTQEDQFECLQMIQEFTGVPYGVAELQLIHQYYLKKVKYKTDATATQKLQQAFSALTRLEVDKAKSLLSELE